jgi:CHAT domain-containing protein
MTRGYLRPARKLHDWIVGPIESMLSERGVDTLVFVPGQLLRGIPMAALHDGNSHLVERYALGLTPGLSMVDPRPVEIEESKILLAGVSEAVQGFSALEGVGRELAAIRDLEGGDLLLDDGFDKQRFEQRLEVDEPAIVHLASHAVFTGTPSTSFVLTHDGKLGFEELGRILNRSQYRSQPVELLVLSACETSRGNDRASMGLTGLAVRAGARSAMGSLWSISDEASFELIVRFYTELGAPGVSKAEALRRAQRSLIENRTFRHPFYWSSFLLVNNWM